MVDKRRIRVLVLDDDVLMLKIAQTQLWRLGFSMIDLCDSGAYALDVLGAGDAQPKLILLDINMPNMDGIEFIRHLVDREFSGAIILVSGEDFRVLQSIQTLLAAHHLNCVGLLMKPLNREALSKIVEDWLAYVPAHRLESNLEAQPEQLSAAIAAGELVNYYQPKVSFQTGAVVGFETLVRWNSPVDGMLFPDQFIRVAEEFELIDALTECVLHAALQQARVWQDAGYQWRIAVNISMKNLTSLRFLDQVVNFTQHAAVYPPSIVFEVTESCLADDLRIPLEILTRLHIKRFRLSIDDFGTGNSSLSQLTAIPFDELKIDQRFAHGAHSDATRCAAFDASLGLAKQLGMEAVAEGVEDREDWDFLQSKGCDVAQGYFVSKPLPAGGVIDWLQSWETRRADLSCSSGELV